MSSSDLLAKKAKGAEEVRTRAHGLQQELRAHTWWRDLAAPGRPRLNDRAMIIVNRHFAG